MKTLLTTTALVGAFAFAGVAAAGGAAGTAGAGLNVTVGGYADFQAGFQDHDNDTNTNGVGFQNDTEIHVKVEGETENGLKYGAVIELEADVNTDDKGEGGNADKTYIFVESDAGRVELGSNVGVEETLKVGAESIARATGGIDGDFYEYLGTDSATGTTPFVISPDLPLQHGSFTSYGSTHGGTEDANKISYYTPRVAGVQAGISYTPDTGITGTSGGGGFVATGGTNYEDVIAAGVNYAGEVEGVGIEAGVTATFGDAQTNTNEDLSAWNAGLALEFEGFTLAGSYGDLGDVGTIASNSEADYFTLGAGFETGPYAVSVTYLDSTYEVGSNDNDFENISIGADYELAPGLVPYAEVNFFDFDATGTANDNDGNVFIVGTQLTF